MSHHVTRHPHGFTVIEALVVIMIVGLLLGLAAPSFVTFTSSQKVKTASFDLYAAMMLARSEAIKRRKCISVIPASGSDWTSGWKVQEVADTATCVPAPASDPVVRSQDSLSGVVMGGATRIVYRLDGRLNGLGVVGVLIQPQVADSSIKNRCIRVDQSGLPKSTNISDTTCICTLTAMCS